MNAPTDFNDLHQTAGADAVRACIEAAALVATSPMLEDLPEAGTAAPWPEPVPLVASIESEPYPVEALPLTIREAVQEVQAFAQAPVAMVATSALSALSLAAWSASTTLAARRQLSWPVEAGCETGCSAG